ncbi:hypothetical protein Q1695_010914 [Nippostrongylus brasiliensis]|nr:hypothetical protein Q1695_010914 [Nippostrongylus brasiliensis]
MTVSRGAQGDTDDQVMDESFSIEFVDKQTCLDKGVDNVMQQIKDKEELLLKASESQKDVDESTKQHTQEMTSLQQRIDALLAEKAKLEADLKKKSVNSRTYQYIPLFSLKWAEFHFILHDLAALRLAMKGVRVLFLLPYISMARERMQFLQV